MSDVDGDSAMHSSPDVDLAANDDEMFPDEAQPTTPHNAASYALDPTSELSPPNSQGPAILPRDDSIGTTIASGVNANGKRPLSGVATAASTAGVVGTHQDADTGYQWSKLEDQPGYEWKNNRAREEEARALDQIVDKGHQIKNHYGDPLDASVSAGKSRR
ncbi:hypothetical protein P153DRAFT_365013 [Dothidotthia symphoricarpi CBS 119687]|uniref:Uncharacterized protein n=1 Tax=Dothidotthia symphoricarpi CBS 119687 TaxID=1392245 RepID=A0A6A6AKI4_9PLEO|nr:uncharacterized protein P153DRAFT_365013 [Dothidotthia symphoricarpi CBS 119687]KAF2131424.1 hypothetical protein P153DRAFT_365013 [Dothidotthia symphoricarpi CBS 119687]